MCIFRVGSYCAQFRCSVHQHGVVVQSVAARWYLWLPLPWPCHGMAVPWHGIPDLISAGWDGSGEWVSVFVTCFNFNLQSKTQSQVNGICFIQTLLFVQCSKMHLYRASRWLYRGLVGANSPHYHITAHMAHTAQSYQGSKEVFGLTNLFSVAHTWYLSIIYFYAFCGKFHTRKCVNWQQNFLATKTQCRVTHWI